MIIIIALIVFAGAFVQSSIGFGFALVATLLAGGVGIGLAGRAAAPGQPGVFVVGVESGSVTTLELGALAPGDSTLLPRQAAPIAHFWLQPLDQGEGGHGDDHAPDEWNQKGPDDIEYAE